MLAYNVILVFPSQVFWHVLAYLKMRFCPRYPEIAGLLSFSHIFTISPVFQVPPPYEPDGIATRQARVARDFSRKCAAPGASLGVAPPNDPEVETQQALLLEISTDSIR